ncbi:TIGR03085 family metal-binding protein [soil metagenome]
MNLAQTWRRALCDVALSYGPEAPTLCEGWDVRDLLAHLSVRDARPDALLAMALPGAARYAEWVRERATRANFEEVVAAVRAGPPRMSPLSVHRLDEAVNTTEFLIHHEDIVRGADPHSSQRGQSGQPEDAIDPASATAAWKALTRAGPLMYRTAPVGLVVVAPGHGRAALRRPPTGAGTVVMTGQPLELLLYAFGRTGAASVQVAGAAVDIAAYAAAFSGQPQAEGDR